MGNISVNYFEFGPVVQEEKSMWQPSCSAERNHLCNVNKGP